MDAVPSRNRVWWRRCRSGARGRGRLLELLAAGNHFIEGFVAMRRSSRGLMAALIGAVTSGVVVIPLTPAMAGPAPIQTVSFHLSGHAEIWTVPAGVSALRVVADGARGGQGGPRGLGGH